MTEQSAVSQEDWFKARLELLEPEKLPTMFT
jgi:hypothetical protein